MTREHLKTAPLTRAKDGTGMVPASLALRFWTVVEDCLVQFHDFERNRAAHTVTTCWRRLPKAARTKYHELSFEDMIYHAEPWYIACNLAGRDLPLDTYQSEYRELLRRNALA